MRKEKEIYSYDLSKILPSYIINEVEDGKKTKEDEDKGEEKNNSKVS